MSSKRYCVHDPLLNRLRELVQQRPFYSEPKLGWITGNYLDRDYLDRLTEIAPAYGVRRLIFSDEYFEWGRGLDTVRGNWLAGMASRITDKGLEVGVLVNDSVEKEKMESEITGSWQVPVHLYSKQDTTIVDGVSIQFGGGRLPYLALNTMIGKEALVRIDRPGAEGEDLGSWGNVFGISYHLLSGAAEVEKIETEYFQGCFDAPGAEVQRAFGFARQAIEKSFLVRGTMNLMERGCWPESLEWLDRQLDFAITRDVLSQIDLEKIEGLEAVHDGWKILETIRPQLEPRAFLWLEDQFQRLKIVCLILRLLAETYFAGRGRARETVKLPDHVLWSKYKDFIAMVREHRALLTEMDRRSRAGGAQPLKNLISELRPAIP